MHRLTFISSSFVCCVVICACLAWNSGCGGEKKNSIVEEFDRLVGNFLSQHPMYEPEEATEFGAYETAGRLQDITPEGVMRRAAWYRAYVDSLHALDQSRLDAERRIDRDLFLGHLHAQLWELTSVQRWKSDPLWYDGGRGIRGVLEAPGMTLPQRAASLRARLEALPAWYTQARNNLEHPSRIHTVLAVQHALATLRMFSGELRSGIDSMEVAEGPLHRALEEAERAQRDQARWLEDVLLPQSTGSLRLHPENYRQRYSSLLQASIPPAALRLRAQREAQESLQEMFELALPLFHQMFPKRELPSSFADTRHFVIHEVLRRLSDHRASDHNAAEEARAAMDEVRSFVAQHHLMSLPEESLEVVAMPDYQTGAAVAVCEFIPPRVHVRPRIFVARPPMDWMESRRDAWYRDNNLYMLRTLMAHEAIPGHGLQQLRAMAHTSASGLRRYFPNIAMAEGWACYGERLLSEQGFGGPEVRLHQLKMRLRMIVNALIDLGLHLGGMTEAEALELLRIQGFADRGEARARWERIVSSPVRMTAFYAGYCALIDARTRQQRIKRSDFQLRHFHDAVLDLGSIPPRLLHEALESRP